MTKLYKLFEAINLTAELCTEGELREALAMINTAEGLSGAEADTLFALSQFSPLEDGDVPSKNGRDCLVAMGLAARIVVNGAHGYTACTYKGYSVAKLRGAMASDK